MDARTTTMLMHPIGWIERDGDRRRIRLEASHKDGLAGLGGFSHIVVLWWAGDCDDPRARAVHQVPLPYAPDVRSGVFACRAPVRPNPIMTTVCEILDVDEKDGRLLVRDIDAFDGTPVVDVKPYYGVTDRVRDPRVPAHAGEWPEWFPREGTGLMPGEK